ncbi:hypothetical protein [Butyrivibrio sp. M55]|uniref:hypothetical protein n=1 Tax=Butyrivibrio sp. M55 TaxID=1855323 RepID=UPI0008E15B43|nr:hypothetical protein [Butyrivibrio sp. M55]SFU91060.1 hypothetical protein SAMN05216540_12033 [Butyrivibrio sp. M55]
MAKGNSYNRKKENYYEMTLYFSSSKKEEVSLYFFLKQLTQRRKATAFITKLFSEYLRLCGYKDPTSIKYEDIKRLPCISELIEKKKQNNEDAAGLLNMLKSLMTQESKSAYEPTQERIRTVGEPKAISFEKEKISLEPEGEIEEDTPQDNENIDNSWLTGLASFMGGQ